jgi:hypothetical protein
VWSDDQGGLLELMEKWVGPKLAYELEEVPAGKKKVG